MSVTVILQSLSCPLLLSLGNYLDHPFLLPVWILACLQVPACKLLSVSY